MPQHRVPATAPGWLPLGAASRLVGVDPDTLRRWADEGRVEVFHTPGGHRRFRRGALERLTRGPSARRASLVALGATPDSIAAAYRRRYGHPRGGSPDPVRAVPPADRDVFRDEGRLLVTALARHLDAADRPERDAAFAEASSLVRAHAARLAAGRTSLTEAVALFVAARRPFLSAVGSAARRKGLAADRLSALFGDASAALDRLLIVFVEAYRAADLAPVAARGADAGSGASPTPGGRA